MSPKTVTQIETKYRRIVTEFPVPESLPLLERLRRYEPRAMQGQPPVVWDRAEGFQVWDPYGNCWIDWSSGVLITNAGHGRQEIIDAIQTAGRLEAADELLLSERDSRPAGGAARDHHARAAQESVPAHHGIRGGRMRHQALPDAWSESRRPIEACDRVLRQVVSRPDARLAAGGWNSGAEGMDRQSGSGIRAGPFP